MWRKYKSHSWKVSYSWEEHAVRLKQIQTRPKNLISTSFCFWESQNSFFVTASTWFVPTHDSCTVYKPSQCLLAWPVRAGLVSVREPSICKAGDSLLDEENIPVLWARCCSYAWDQPWTHTALGSGIYRIVNSRRDVRHSPVTLFPLPSKSTSLKRPETSCLWGYSQLR